MIAIDMYSRQVRLEVVSALSAIVRHRQMTV